MAYSVAADIYEVLPQSKVAELTDDSAGTTVDTTIVARLIEDADSLIDSYLNGKYTVPFTTVPDSIKAASCELAVYYMYRRRNPEDMPDFWFQSYNDRLAWLKKVADGEIILDSGDPDFTSKYITSKTKDDSVFLARSNGYKQLNEFFNNGWN